MIHNADNYPAGESLLKLILISCHCDMRSNPGSVWKKQTTKNSDHHTQNPD